MILMRKFDTNLNTKYLRNKILKNEKSIIQKYPPTNADSEDAGNLTGLGSSSLTARNYHFNVLDWWGTKKLKQTIKKCYQEFTTTKPQPLYVQCWANVMRAGQQIHWHNHGDLNHVLRWNLISGKIFIYGDVPTYSYYETREVPDKVGELTLHSSHVNHSTDVYNGKSERISIAFDIRDERAWKEDVYDYAKTHWKKI